MQNLYVNEEISQFTIFIAQNIQYNGCDKSSPKTSLHETNIISHKVHIVVYAGIPIFKLTLLCWFAVKLNLFEGITIILPVRDDTLGLPVDSNAKVNHVRSIQCPMQVCNPSFSVHEV